MSGTRPRLTAENIEANMTPELDKLALGIAHLFELRTQAWAINFMTGIEVELENAVLSFGGGVFWLDGHVVMDFREEPHNIPRIAPYNGVRLRFCNDSANVQVLTLIDQDVERDIGTFALNAESGVDSAGDLVEDCLLGLVAYMTVRRLS